MEKINIRSPYFIKYTDAVNDYVKLELFIYDGSSVTDRGAATYTLQKTIPVNVATFEVSELIRDYLDVRFSGGYASYMIWVDYRFTPGTVASGDGAPLAYNVCEAYDGYGYFNEGAQTPTNQYNEDLALISNDIIYHYVSKALLIPIRRDSIYTVVSKLNGVQQAITNVTDDVDYIDRVQYLSYNTTTTPIDELLIDGTRSIRVELIEECKYEPIKVTFVNKFGALQDIWFFKNNSSSISAKSTDYKSNLMVNDTYSTTSHQNTTLNINGTEKLTINSGFYPESYNEVFKQLLLSEKVWILVDSVTYPVKITSKSLKFKTQLNEKLIEYALDLEFSNDIINNIR